MPVLAFGCAWIALSWYGITLLVKLLLLLLPYRVQLQPSENSDTFSACWVLLAFPPNSDMDYRSWSHRWEQTYLLFGGLFAKFGSVFTIFRTWRSWDHLSHVFWSTDDEVCCFGAGDGEAKERVFDWTKTCDHRSPWTAEERRTLTM